MRLHDMLFKMAERLDLQDETIPGVPLVELLGSNRILIENHLGVRRFGTEQISVCMSYGMLCVGGKQLQLRRMSEGQLIISGQIEQLTVLKGERE